MTNVPKAVDRWSQCELHKAKPDDKTQGHSRRSIILIKWKSTWTINEIKRVAKILSIFLPQSPCNSQQRPKFALAIPPRIRLRKMRKKKSNGRTGWHVHARRSSASGWATVAIDPPLLAYFIPREPVARYSSFFYNGNSILFSFLRTRIFQSNRQRRGISD